MNDLRLLNTLLTEFDAKISNELNIDPLEKIVHDFANKPKTHPISKAYANQHPEIPKVIWIRNTPNNGKKPSKEEDA